MRGIEVEFKVIQKNWASVCFMTMVAIGLRFYGAACFIPKDDAEFAEDILPRRIIALASQHGHYGYRRLTTMLNPGDFAGGKDRVQRPGAGRACWSDDFATAWTA